MELAWPQWADVAVAFVAAVLLALAVTALLTRYWIRQNDPDDRELRRRVDVNAHGRITSGEVVDIMDQEAVPNGVQRQFVHYRYSVSAVDFAASQDVTMIADLVGDDPRGVIGPVSVKYHQKNPYNSIIVCETWSGLERSRVRGASAETADGQPLGSVPITGG
jgi:hypothetical protein